MYDVGRFCKAVITSPSPKLVNFTRVYFSSLRFQNDAGSQRLTKKGDISPTPGRVSKELDDLDSDTAPDVDTDSEELDIENSPDDDLGRKVCSTKSRFSEEDLEAADKRHEENLAAFAAFRPLSTLTGLMSSDSDRAALVHRQQASLHPLIPHQMQTMSPWMQNPIIHHPNNLQALLLPFASSINPQESKVNQYSFPLVSMPK